MKARRIYPDKDGNLYLPPELCYGRDKDGMWYFRHHDTYGGNLSLYHTVTEHEDGTITVCPSIRMVGPKSSDHSVTVTIHGYLTRGVWRDC